MAMLAEPKRKRKFSLDPRGLAWSTDNNKVGQRLIEKMGWSHGKGLGRNENGRVEHIKVQLRMDNRGLGCSRQMADTWTAHGDDFSALLQNLNAEHGSVTASDQTAPPEDGVISLEEKSKNCRSRVHYHRFVRGKDLSGYKETDMKSIFGNKKPNVSTTESSAITDGESKAELLGSKVETNSEEQTFGVTTIKSTSTMAEYFAQKMAARKLNSSTNLNALSASTPLPSSVIEQSDITSAIGQLNDTDSRSVNMTGKETAEVDCVFSVDEQNEICQPEVQVQSKSAKKKKKSKREENDNTIAVPENEHCNMPECNGNTLGVDNAIEGIYGACDTSNALVKKKSKKRKHLDCTEQLPESEEITDETTRDSEVLEQSKKRKSVKKLANSIIDEVVPKNEITDNAKDNEQELAKQSKKQKKLKTFSDSDVNENENIQKKTKKLSYSDPPCDDPKTSKELGFTGSNLGKIKGYGKSRNKL